VAGRHVRGNPSTLVTSYINNYELRYEFYPGAGEILAVSLFRKEFDKPIERFTDPHYGGESQAPVTWKNAVGATSKGVEFEARKSLGFISNRLGGLIVGGNLAFINSEVRDSIPGSGSKQVSFDRPLTGESPYVVNLILSYSRPQSGSEATLLYNAFGDRLVELGTFVTDPAYYEQTRHVVDFTCSQRIWRYVSLRFGAKNLLDEDYLVTQTVKITTESGTIEQENVIEQYEMGRSLSLGITWSI
jgi:outer membrane receptor protein involved in Fe transport